VRETEGRHEGAEQVIEFAAATGAEVVGFW
jgi:hypothetical protein